MFDAKKARDYGEASAREYILGCKMRAAGVARKYCTSDEMRRAWDGVDARIRVLERAA